MDFARVFGGQPALPKAHLVTVETDLSRGLHAFKIVGLPEKAVNEAGDRMSAAIKNSNFDSPKTYNKKIVISLAPAELKKEGGAYDLPVALSYLLAKEDIQFNPAGKLFAGELGLDGTVQPIRGALTLAILAKEKGYNELYIPETNAHEASLVTGVDIYPVKNLVQLINHLGKFAKQRIKKFEREESEASTEEGTDLADIRGQENAKRALEIAIAGGHNIALYGPPGTGKTMLSRAAASLLPQLSESEAIEVTTIHSLAGLAENGAIMRAPFRSPHHTSSYAALIGGGTNPRPGEVTLAHRGVLFLDEFPEFRKDVINALREPLEDGKVSVARAKGSYTFPANFILIAALNPCPCGKAGTRACTCMPHNIEKYKRKISGPIADRVDIWIQVGDMPPETFMQKGARTKGESQKARERIAAARNKQSARFAKIKKTTNADMGPKEIESIAGLSDAAEKALVDAATKLKLSARGFHRTIKVARTVADLAGSDTIEIPHMLEALQYRQREL